mmetsp:Transcript_42209/g.86075  ORF Transcript_42209/g.86075 Transcript_42209/m.86075 type:complete len:478 (+) Transcript_42209:41-1474(+)
MDAPLDVPPKMQKMASFRAMLQKSKSDPPLVTDLDPTPMSEALSQPHSLFERLESPCTTDRFDRDFMRQDIKRRRRLQEEALKESGKEQLPQLSNPEQMGEDMTLHRSMRVTLTAVPTASLSWLRFLPYALRMPGLKGDDLDPVARAEAMEICQQHVSHLMTDPEKACRWLCRIASLLTWYEMEGPLNLKRKQVPNEATSQTLEAEQKDWDESYRSLWVLLRQGSVPTFCIEAERFSILVFGDNSGSWTQGSEPVKPSRSEPLALLWPSTREIRALLHENHAHFDVPGGSDGGAGACLGSGATEQTLAELRELHRDGEKATTLGLRDLEDTSSPALLFKGSWRVHVLMDVLRQYFLGQPNPSAPPSPTRLPRLLSPKPFVNARAKTAEVVKLSTDPATELRGSFFPQQLQYFLTLLRVSYPKFRCELGAGRGKESSQGPQGRGGLNAFTLLKQHRIESVSCDRVDGGAADKWHFRIV